jgi:integrase
VVTTSTKSRRARDVPLADQAGGALDRLSQRGDFTSGDDYAFANRLGRRLDGSAVRRRVDRARDRAALRPLRFHDLRHTYGSLLVAGGIDLASVKAAMGHSRITRQSAIYTPGPRASSRISSPARSRPPNRRFRHGRGNRLTGYARASTSLA